MTRALATIATSVDIATLHGRLVGGPAPARSVEIVTRIGDQLSRDQVRVSNILTRDELVALHDAASALMAPARTAAVAAAVDKLLAAYRQTDFFDPERAPANMTEVLLTYPVVAIQALADFSRPDHIVRRQKFVPTIAEVCEWLDDIVRVPHSARNRATLYLAALDRIEAVKADPSFVAINDLED